MPTRYSRWDLPGYLWASTTIESCFCLSLLLPYQIPLYGHHLWCLSCAFIASETWWEICSCKSRGCFSHRLIYPPQFLLLITGMNRNRVNTGIVHAGFQKVPVAVGCWDLSTHNLYSKQLMMSKTLGFVHKQSPERPPDTRFQLVVGA